MGDDPLGLTPTAEELISEISGAFIEHQRPPEGSFTLADFVALTGASSDSTAYRYLTDLVTAGKLGRVKIGNTNYYYRKQEAK